MRRSEQRRFRASARALPALLSLSLFFGSAVASAQPVDDASRAAGRQLGYEGVNAYTAGDYETASERLERAYAILRVPTVGLWSARSLARLGKLVAASERYQEVGRLPLPDVESEVHKKAQSDAQEERAALLPRLAHLRIVVSTTPASSPSFVTLDGQKLPAAVIGTELPVDPGTRHLELHMGERTTASDVTVAEGESQSVELALADEVVPAPVPPPVHEAPVAREPAQGSTMRTAGWITAGVGAAGVVFGAIMGGIAASEDARLGDVCRDGVCPTRETDAVDAYQSQRTLSIVGLWVGGAAVAAGIVLVLVAPRPARASVSMTVGPGTFGLMGRY